MLTPPKELSFLCVARKGGNFFKNFYGHPGSLRMCGAPPYFLVRVSLNEEGLYWGWWTPDKGIRFIYPSKTLLDICFPYSLKVEEERDVGRVVRVDVCAVRSLSLEEEQMENMQIPELLRQE